MKDYAASDLRSFAVVGHASSGKTMLCEAMLACSGRIGRMGSIAAGTTVSDYHPSEKQHQISVHASLLNTEWQNRKFNLIDCPGYADFISEALSALRVGDFALLVINAAHGIGVGTDAMWANATLHGLPRMIVINGLDKPNVNFDQVLADCRAHFGKNVFPLSIPLDAGPGFSRVLDVPRSEVTTYKPGTNGAYTEIATDGELAERVHQLHKELIEYVAESDDALMEKFFEQGVLAEEEMRAGLHKAIQNQVFVPVFAVSAETNVGVARLMDFIAKYGSSPLDRSQVDALDAKGAHVTVPLSHAEPVVYIFKTMNEPGVGELSLFRVYSGTVTSGAELFNSSRNVTERLGQIYVLNGHERTPTQKLGAGDIGAVVKLRDTHTDDTLCSPRFQVILPKVQFPKPNIHGALRLRAKGDEDKLAVGLSTLHSEDPTFHYRVDDELHQTILSGQGEIHLQVICERLLRRFGVNVELIEPGIPYRETIRGRGESRYRHKKQTGGAGQFAEVWLRIEPGPRDSGVDFKQSLVGTNVDRVFVPSVEKGVKTACIEGVRAGFRVTDVKIDFFDGKMHPVDSKDIAFQVAGYHAFKEAFQASQPCMLEPIYKVSIMVPEEYMGAIMGDLSSRRGQIQGVDSDGQFQIVRAEVPQKELHHYSTVVRSLTSGRGRHDEAFSHYAELPAEQEAKLLAEAKAKRDAAHGVVTK
ncbi:elongation factor G [Opitutus terrae]|uniref:Elongation factor G n=1 Tax=Opitutus terrae (strain DSM 11246 / JCM 15787 / PB90-1) TaxID=452637 RepID=B1ZN57_OPITP|nr:elongation factor G [Opitutus terrae]ACB73426.1 small GTP-binding protein [Opitutus terrae PB90-1]